MTPDQRSKSLHPQAEIGIRHFNKGQYFEAHEYLELAWMNSIQPERDLYQGILQIGIAYYQIKRGNYRGGIKMFRRGQQNLFQLPDTMLGVNLVQFRLDAQEAESALRSLGPDEIGKFDQDLFKAIPRIF